MCENEELISILRLDCILAKPDHIVFRIYSEDRYANETVDNATLEMFYAWSKIIYESDKADILCGGKLINGNEFEFKIRNPKSTC